MGGGGCEVDNGWPGRGGGGGGDVGIGDGVGVVSAGVGGVSTGGGVVSCDGGSTATGLSLASVAPLPETRDKENHQLL